MYIFEQDAQWLDEARVAALWSFDLKTDLKTKLANKVFDVRAIIFPSNPSVPFETIDFMASEPRWLLEKKGAFIGPRLSLEKAFEENGDLTPEAQKQVRAKFAKYLDYVKDYYA